MRTRPFPLSCHHSQRQCYYWHRSHPDQYHRTQFNTACALCRVGSLWLHNWSTGQSRLKHRYCQQILILTSTRTCKWYCHCRHTIGLAFSSRTNCEMIKHIGRSKLLTCGYCSWYYAITVDHINTVAVSLPSIHPCSVFYHFSLSNFMFW